MAGAAYAGLIQPAPVTIDLDNRIASGDMLTARVSKNDFELIGCGIRQIDNGVNPPFSFGFCQATDSDEQIAFCSTLNDNLLDVMKASSAYSFVTFSWNENDECTRIGFSTQSFYLPNKKADKN